MQFAVKGAYFRGKEVRDLSDSLEEDAQVTVRREPDNQHDEYACAVFYEDIHIGYVEADMSFLVSGLFDEDGHEEVTGRVIGHEQPGRAKWPVVQLDGP